MPYPQGSLVCNEIHIVLAKILEKLYMPVCVHTCLCVVKLK